MLERLVVAATIGALLLNLVGCMVGRRVGLEGRLAQPRARIHSKQGEPIRGYTTSDGVYHKFQGRVRLPTRDSLEFYRVPQRALGGRLEKRQEAIYFRVARQDVSTIFVERTDPVRTTFAVIGVVVASAAVLFLIALATKESCPFIYSWNGSQFVFDGEPYGGATMRALERTDWSELEHLVPEYGRYRLLLTNEVDETQHTNQLALLVVDHAPGTTVVMDTRGRPHAFRRLAPPIGASDERGRDLLVWLRDTDHSSWHPDLAGLASEDSLADTRNHVTLTFERPAGANRGYLVCNVATGQWGSHMIRSMLGMRGNQVQEFYAAINGSPLYRKQLLDWNKREELYELVPEVRVGSRWMPQQPIPGGGPFISETRAIPLDLGEVAGNTVEIRLHPPIGFWSFNSFRLAWEEDETLQVSRLAPRRGKGVKGVNVAATLAAADSNYLDFPTRQDHAEIVFDASGLVPGLQRTVFAETRGWYELHLHRLGKPDVAGLARLTDEPGYAVRRALREYAEYQRTGVLLGAE